MGRIEIIYEKKYPHVDPLEELEQAALQAADEPAIPMPPFSEMMEKFNAKSSYIFLPERVKASEKFIQTAIEVSELYELDTRIERHVDHISVNYAFDCGCMRHINRVFGMADQCAFFKDVHGWDITVSLDFFTHAMKRSGGIAAI